jgi:hypothetical protein
MAESLVPIRNGKAIQKYPAGSRKRHLLAGLRVVPTEEWIASQEITGAAATERFVVPGLRLLKKLPD